MSKKKGPRKPRDRELQKRVRERMKRTGELYQLAWRRLTETTRSESQPVLASTPPIDDGGATTIDEVLARDRRQRAAPPFTRPEYAQDVDTREAEFGFVRRIVMTPMRMGTEPDRMYAVVAEMDSVLGHQFAIKLVAGGYEIRTTDMSHPSDTLGTFDDLVAKYGAHRRIRFEPSALPTGIESVGTFMPQARLARLIHQRFATSDLTRAVRAAEPERKFLHFGSPRFEMIHPSARYARFSVEYVDLLKEDKAIPDGTLFGEVAIDVRVGDDQAIADGLRLVDARVLDPRGIERDLSLEDRVKAERRWEHSPDGPALQPMEIRLGDGPFSRSELADAHRRVPPAHTLLVRKMDFEYGDYHQPVVVYDMRILDWVKQGYRTLTTSEIQGMYPDPIDNADVFGP